MLQTNTQQEAISNLTLNSNDALLDTSTYNRSSATSNTNSKDLFNIAKSILDSYHEKVSPSKANELATLLDSIEQQEPGLVKDILHKIYKKL